MAAASAAPPAMRAAVRPTVRFLLAHPAHFIALGFGAGLSRVAPGTVGTLWAWLAYLGPTALLGIGAVAAWSRWRRTDRDLRAEV